MTKVRHVDNSTIDRRFGIWRVVTLYSIITKLLTHIIHWNPNSDKHSVWIFFPHPFLSIILLKFLWTLIFSLKSHPKEKKDGPLLLSTQLDVYLSFKSSSFWFLKYQRLWHLSERLFSDSRWFFFWYPSEVKTISFRVQKNNFFSSPTLN